MGFRFALVSTDGEVFDSFESAVPDWSAGDTVIASGNSAQLRPSEDLNRGVYGARRWATGGPPHVRLRDFRHA